MPSNAFGIYLRAARLGFHWCLPARAYIRVAFLYRSDDPVGDRYSVDAARMIEDFTKLPPRRIHIQWWRDDHYGTELWALCRGLREMTIPGSITADDGGERVITVEDCHV